MSDHATAPVGIFGADDPVTQARSWLAEATRTEPTDANAMALATVDADGLPNVRMVLLKAIEDDAFVFYTNYKSDKSLEIEANPRCAFVMHWKSLARQVRVRGRVARVDGSEADAYFATRATDSRLGAWASRQSRPLSDRQTLMDEVASARTRHGDDPARPDHWGGWRIVPDAVEFWSDGANRLHDRERWIRGHTTSGWSVQRLYP